MLPLTGAYLKLLGVRQANLLQRHAGREQCVSTDGLLVMDDGTIPVCTVEPQWLQSLPRYSKVFIQDKTAVFNPVIFWLCRAFPMGIDIGPDHVQSMMVFPSLAELMFAETSTETPFGVPLKWMADRLYWRTLWNIEFDLATLPLPVMPAGLVAVEWPHQKLWSMVSGYHGQNLAAAALLAQVLNKWRGYLSAWSHTDFVAKARSVPSLLFPVTIKPHFDPSNEVIAAAGQAGLKFSLR